MKIIGQYMKRLHCALYMCAACCGMALALASCHGKGMGQLRSEVDSFAVNYFNWQYHKAVRYVTHGSMKWISFAASQVHQADINLLKDKEVPATCEIVEVAVADDGLTAVAHVNIHDFLRMDTIGKAATVVDEAHFDIPLRYSEEEGEWKVDMQAALRPVTHGQ